MTVTQGAGRPKAGYFTKAGKRVPGVTTVLGRFKESGGLMYWAWQQGMQGLDYRNTSGLAATAGVLAHARIEASILGAPRHRVDAEALKITEVEWKELDDKAETAFGAFQAWRQNTQADIVATELPFVSDELGFGGTIDAVARINGELCVLDWKSSNKVYPDHLVQVAAYRALWNSQPDLEKIRTGYLLRVDKTFGGFDHKMWPGELLDVGEEAFMLMLQLYELDKIIKKAVG